MKEEILNRKMQLRYEQDPTEDNFTAYIMSELLSPIEDYYHVMNLIEDRMNEIKDDRLLYLASYLNTDWGIGKANVFLAKLNEKVESASDNEKAIIYYLNAYDMNKPGGGSFDREKYKLYLQQSIKHAKEMSFSSNRRDLAKIVGENESKNLLKEAKDNVKYVLSMEELRQLSDEYWLDIQRWVDEYILGILITSDIADKE